MKRFSIWKILKYPPQFLYAIGLGPIYGRDHYRTEVWFAAGHPLAV